MPVPVIPYPVGCISVPTRKGAGHEEYALDPIHGPRPEWNVDVCFTYQSFALQQVFLDSLSRPSRSLSFMSAKSLIVNLSVSMGLPACHGFRRCSMSKSYRCFTTARHQVCAQS